MLIVETELWPNLLREAEGYRAKIVLVNARLSDRSFRGYRLFRRLMRPLLERIDLVSARSETDAERFRLLGARPERVVVTGNLKFDVEPAETSFGEELASALATARRAPVMVAGSTMPGEETLLLEAWLAVRARFPQALLILAPRHPARFEEVARLLGERQACFVRRTALSADRGTVAGRLASPEVLLLDTIGELAGVFALADLVFVGGSLVPAGGHNPLEPAFSGKAILFGPHMENFSEIAGLFLRSGGALQVRDVRGLTERALELLGDSALRQRLGAKAKQVVEQGSGASERVLEALKPLLESADRPLSPS